MTAQLSRERSEIIKQTANHIISREDTSEHSENLKAVAELAILALAGLDSEPVAYIGERMLDSMTDGARSCGRVWRSDTDELSGESRIPLYTAPPAPVAVPDDVLKKLLPDVEKSDFWFEHDGKIFFEGVKFNNAVFDACRAAMLNAGPVTGWIKCSDRMPDETQPVITVAEGGVVQRTVYQFCDGVWVDWYEQYDEVKVDAFTHWMPLPAAPEQEV